MLDGRWRPSVDKGTGPLGEILHRHGVTADLLTCLGLVMGVGMSVLIATGHLFWGLVTMVAAAVPDLLDGPVAKAAGTASMRGAFFDSTADRVTDALLFGAIAWWLVDHKGGHWPILALAVLAMTSLISYERAKAESLGFVARGGLFERAERFVVVSFGLGIAPLMIPVLWILLVGTGFTAVQRFFKVWKQATAVKTAAATGGSPAATAKAVPAPKTAASEDADSTRSRRFSTRDSETSFEERWQAWRAANRADRVRRPAWSERDRSGLGDRWRERRTATRGSDRPPRRRPRSRP